MLWDAIVESMVEAVLYEVGDHAVDIGNNDVCESIGLVIHDALVANGAAIERHWEEGEPTPPPHPN